MNRLIAFSDGLWTSTSSPGNSNLGLLSRSLSAKSSQIIFTDPFQSLAEISPCGRRLDFLQESICALYYQLALNYSPGNSLWFFGFARGSFVVRSCIGLIRNIGLLKRVHLDKLPEAWHIYQTTWGADANNARRFKKSFSLQPTIKFLGVFDTVGELGIPSSINGENTVFPKFHDNKLSSAVEYAYHALAIDERHKNLKPCLWRTSAERSQTEQCWFTGNHKDIGGIQGDGALSNISLRWMASRAISLGLEVDRSILESAMNQRCEAHHEEYDSGRVRKTGTKTRPIGELNSDETLHSSAEQRFLRDEGYQPANLKVFIQQDNQIQLPL